MISFKKQKINAELITTLPRSISRLRNIETCYSAVFSEIHKQIVFPSINTGEIYIYSSINNKLITKIKLPKGSKPDIAIFKKDKIYVGCRDTFPPIEIDQNFKYKKIFDSRKSFYPTSFKLSPSGKLFIGNLYGNPCILSDEKIEFLQINGTQTYDCLWISDKNLLISSTWENRIINLKNEKGDWKIKESYPIIQPYRFSPILENKTILTSRGWYDRPGMAHLLDISKIRNQKNYSYKPKSVPGYEKQYIIPDIYFPLKKYLPKRILSFLKIDKYTGYINDVAWISKDLFVVTTKHGGALVFFNISGEVQHIKYINTNSELTRFIDTRGESLKHFFVDAKSSSIFSFLYNY